jgi:hypothetical protein
MIRMGRARRPCNALAVSSFAVAPSDAMGASVTIAAKQPGKMQRIEQF